jgi:hypothetical protein
MSTVTHIRPADALEPQLAAIKTAPDTQLADLVIDLEEQLGAQDDEHARKTAIARQIVRAGYIELGERMMARNATALPHPDLTVSLVKPKTRLDKRPTELVELFRVLPAEELVGAIWRDKPPAPEEMPWESNGTKLGALARKYGPESEVAKIINRGLVRVDVGLPVVKIERRSKTVEKLVAAGTEALRG